MSWQNILSQNANVRQPKPPNAEQSTDVNEKKKRNRLDCSLHWTSIEKKFLLLPSLLSSLLKHRAVS